MSQLVQRFLNVEVDFDTHNIRANAWDQSGNQVNDLTTPSLDNTTYIDNAQIRYAIDQNGRVITGGKTKFSIPLNVLQTTAPARMTIPDIRNHKSITKTKQMVVFTIVGTGGTGGYVVRDLLRYLYSLKTKGDNRIFEVNLIDADVVEEKNLMRQNFIPSDLGKPKAVVMANRYGGTFGIPTYVYERMVDRSFNVSNAYSDSLNRNEMASSNAEHIVIGCVDNHEARRRIKASVKGKSDTYWIDSGNERTSGQVCVGYLGIENHIGYSQVDIRGSMPSNGRVMMPYIDQWFPEIQDAAQDNAGSDTTSCADRALVEEQNIFINMTSAMNVLNFVRQIVNSEPIAVPYISFGINGVTNPEYLTPETIYKVTENILKR